MDARLDREGRTTAAGAGRVGVLEMEAGELKRLDVVDGRAIQILVAHGIDIHLQAITLNDRIARILLVFQIHVIGEPGASTADDHQPKTIAFQPLLIGHLFDLGNRFVCNQHYSSINSSTLGCLHTTSSFT